VYCCINGEYYLENQASIPANDRGLLLGHGIFETIRVTAKKPCLLELHWQRMRHSADYLNIKIPLSFSQIESQIDELIKKNGLASGGLRLTLSAGVAARGLTAKTPNPCLIIHCFAEQQLKQALTLCLSSFVQDKDNPLLKIKTTNYLSNILARREAEARGFDDAIFVNRQDCVTETTVANLFIIHDDVIKTPPLEDGLLNGVMRQHILKVALIHGLEIEQNSINKETLQYAQAAFVSNSLLRLKSVTNIDGRQLPGHELSARLKALF
jgi:4-amino-4-deoxychorismate lyase